MRTRRALAPVCLLAAALLAAGGCASSGPYWSAEDQGAAETTELRERVASLEAQLAAADLRSAALQAKADNLEREVARLRDPGGAREAFSPPASPVEEPATPPPAGASEPSGYPAEPAEPAVPPSSGIEQSDLEEPDELAAARAAEAPTPAGAAPAAAPDEARELYESSLALLEENRLPEAEEGFRRFLAGNPYSDLADNAQFWLAESALRRADLATALAGFRAVVENYPEANKVPDALLKVGYCLATLGEPESAATVYRELMSRFPETAAAETARQRLANP